MLRLNLFKVDAVAHFIDKRDYGAKRFDTVLIHAPTVANFASPRQKQQDCDRETWRERLSCIMESRNLLVAPDPFRGKAAMG